jgi:hypothetical protein
VAASQTASTHAGCAVNATTNLTRLALESIVTLLTASENTTLLLKVGHGDGWECGGRVVLGSVVVDLVDWDGGVDNVGLNGLCDGCQCETRREWE